MLKISLLGLLLVSVSAVSKTNRQEDIDQIQFAQQSLIHVPTLISDVVVNPEISIVGPIGPPGPPEEPPCWPPVICEAPFYLNPATCLCDCNQTVKCVYPKYFDFDFCKCMCPKLMLCPKFQVWDPIGCKCKCNMSVICPSYKYWDW
jgi:hypothetical protein